MISLLITLLVLLVILYVVKLVIDASGLPENIKKVAYLIVGLITLLFVLGQFGLIGGFPILR
jgi:hypothetical protein